MATTPSELADAIREAVGPDFRERLLARGQARSFVWRDGSLPDGAPPYSEKLTYDLLGYGYSLLSLSLRLLETQTNHDVTRIGFEHAAGAIEAAVSKGQKDAERDFHRFVAAACYHLGQFSARAFSMLQAGFAESNLTPMERAVGLLMLRDLDALSELSVSWRTEGRASDTTITSLLEAQFSRSEAQGPLFEVDSDDGQIAAIDLALTDNFMGAMATALLALERGEIELLERAIERLRIGLNESGTLNLVNQWWCHRLAIYLFRDLWGSSFHTRLPKQLSPAGSENWETLRDLFVALLYRRSRAEIELWPSQIDAAVRATRTDENLVVSLPTSAGKTRIAELCILATLAAGRRVVFVTPLRALSAQTEVILQRTFHPLGKTISTLYGSIGTSDVDENLLKGRDIVVATPEKLDFALRNEPSLIDDVGLIVLDEGHMIGLGEREVRYEAQIQRLLKRSDSKVRRIVCLSAILPTGEKLDDFVNWLTSDQSTGLVQSSWRPTRLRYGEVVWRGTSGRLEVRVGDEETFVPKFITSRVPPKKKRKDPFPRDQRELSLAAAWRLVEEGQSVMIFCPLRASVEPMARAITDLHERGLLPSVLRAEISTLANALSIGGEWLADDHPILECLRLGVAIHHGALPTPFRKEVERLLREGVLKITVSSPTLAQGLNLSATTLIVYSLTRAKEPISGSEFRNVVGRAGRAFVDLEGLVLHPMFDNHACRLERWRELIANDKGHELESGLVRLVVTLLRRMQEKLGVSDANKLIEYVANQASAWSFPELKSESAEQSQVEKRRWDQFLASLDTAILSLVAEDVALDDVELKLDQILSSSLWERRLKRRNEVTQQVLNTALRSRARFIWSKSTARSRRGYFLAGVGLDAGLALDKHATELTKLLIVANSAILMKDESAAIAAITAFAEVIFAIPPFVPDALPEDWRDLLSAWLKGEAIVGIAKSTSEEALEFIEQALVYRLPWGMEAVRVRAIANEEKPDGLSLDDFEMGLAVAAVEAGTLEVAAATIMRAGFASRLAAIKVVRDTAATFRTTAELREWLKSELVLKFTADPEWPSRETGDLWRSFVGSFHPIAEKVWRHQTIELAFDRDSSVLVPPVGLAVRLQTQHDGTTAVLAPDCELIGTLKERINYRRIGLLTARVEQGAKNLAVHYLGPNDLFDG